ncbi:MAG: aldehyde dehydrogenase family protein [Planctomycetes bacterium]|nr:aldehyde dehydrogenase family protein [Planctomycetota bacterium]
MPPRWSLWIEGAEVVAQVDECFSTRNPATGEVLCEVSRGREADADAAVDAARKALPAWAATPVSKRVRILLDVACRIREAEDELALLECLDNGKPLREARLDAQKAAEAFEFYAGVADKLFGKTIPVSPAYFNYTVCEPIGVTAHIAPWNYPLRLAVRSIAPALAAGNTVVLKPSEETPLTGLRLGPLLAEAGVPAGVFNVVPGFGPEAGAALASHPGVNHVAFTGSVPTGIEVMKRAASNVVPVTLELGGKSPNIVFADADLDAALEGTIKAIFTNAGQICCAGTRLLLEDSIYSGFVQRLIERTERVRLGPGLEDPDMGPLISEKQRRTVLEYIDIGRREGAEVLTGGEAPTDAVCRRGYFVEPTLLATSNSARVAQEEIFGPVLTIIRFHNDDEAVRLANDSVYGLVAGVWTSNLDRAHRLASRIQAGQIYINDFFSGTVASPFGGYKRSGFGRERGIEALHHYTQVKSVCIRLKE